MHVLAGGRSYRLCRSRRRRGALLGVVVLVALAFAGRVTAAPPPPYTVVDLNFDTDDQTVANAINLAGQVAGVFTVGLDDQARYWVTPESSAADIPRLGTAGQSQALGLNDAGAVVGWSDTSNGRRGFLWTPGAPGATGLPTLGGDFGEAHGINRHGDVVGISKVADDAPRHAFSYRVGGSIIDLGTLTGSASDSSFGYGVNDAGEVVGDSEAAGSTVRNPLVHGFRFADTNDNGKADPGEMLDLAPLPGDGLSATYAISNAHKAVGVSRTGTTRARATLWDQDRMPVDLGTLGHANSVALAINIAGHVVGSVYDADDSAGHAFLYADAGMEDLNDRIPADSGWILEEARGISDSGQIVGVGRHDGMRHAFLLKPLAVAQDASDVTEMCDTLTYTITYGNVGSDFVDGVVVSGDVPEGAALLSTETTPGGAPPSLDRGTLRWAVGRLEAGVTDQTLTYTVVANNVTALHPGAPSIAADGIAETHGNRVSTAVLGLLTSISDLGVLEVGGASVASGINQDGVVVGYATAPNPCDPLCAPPPGPSCADGCCDAADLACDACVATTGNDHAFVWQDGRMQDLGRLVSPYTCLTGRGSRALGVNGGGLAVGFTGTASEGVQRACKFDGDTVTDLMDLPPTQATYFGARAVAVNSAGDAVGWTLFLDGTQKHAALFHGGAAIDLGTLGQGTESEATAINRDGQIVGWSATQGTSDGLAVLWQNGQKEGLPTFGGTFGSASDIDDGGEVVGLAARSNGDVRTFLWTRAVGLTDITGPFNASAPRISRAGTFAVSNLGILWRLAIDPTAPVDMNSLVPSGCGWRGLSAAGVNDAGQVVGAGLHFGYQHAFLLDVSATSTTTSTSTTSTSTTSPVPASTTTSTLVCVPADCDDGDACTDDECTKGGCQHRDKTGIDALRCLLAGDLAADCPSLPAAIQKKLDGARARLAQASDVTSGKSVHLISKAAAFCRKAAKLAHRAGKRHLIPADCASTLEQVLKDRAARLAATHR